MFKKILISILFVLIFYIFSVDFIFAEEIYVENFDQQTNKWKYNSGNGQINFNDGIMTLFSNAYYFPYIEGDLSNYLSNSNKIKISFMFNYAGGMGNGIGIGFTGLGDINYYQFGIWRDNSTGAFFYYHDFNNKEGGFCNNFSDVNDLNGRQYVYSIFLDNVLNELEIEKFGSGYKVYINREQNPDPIYTTNQNQCTPKMIWFGNKMAGGSYDWTRLHLDKLIIESVPENINKYIIIPGLGASWNTSAMLLPINEIKHNWKMAPFVKNYDNLIKAFEDKGLIKNQDFYVWNYDWRKPINSIVSDFNNYVTSLNFPANTKINIVGHSLGGLVGRIWGQENNNEKLGKIITLGSPNAGAIGAYEMWNGAKIPNNFNGIEKIAINLLLQLQSKKGQKKIDIVHSFLPVLKDLLPVFNFAKKNNSTIAYSNLFYKNDYLNNKNNSVSNIFDNLEAVNGYGFSSNEYLNFGERSVYDKILGYWPDGLINSFTNTKESDGTVLKKSAIFVGDMGYSTGLKHENLPNNYIGEVFSLLGLGNTINPISEFTENNKSIFFIGSPAYLDVMCNDGILRVSDEMGFVIVDNDELKKCQIKVIGIYNGIYHLVLGNSNNENNWHYFEGTINSSEIITIDYDIKNGILINNETNKLFMYEQLIKELKNLKNNYQNSSDLEKTIEFANNKQINNVVDSFFKFRKISKEFLNTGNILNNIETILKIENNNISVAEANKYYKKAVSDKSLIDRLARLYSTSKKLPNEFGANSYKLMDEKMILAKNNLNRMTDLYSYSIIVSKLAGEVW